MPGTPAITLRYFDARGRAQFLRYYLRARDVPFEDARVPLSADFSAWREMRDDRSRAGPFHRLPVMHWGDELVAEALAIRSFLHEALGDAGALSERDDAREAMLVSSAYTDLMSPLGTVIWADILFPGVDVKAVAKGTLQRMRAHLAALDRTLREWGWLEGAAARPLTLASCLLWEELDVAQHVFGGHLTLDGTETLARLYGEHPARETFETLLRERPCQISGRPGEADAIARIHQFLGEDPSPA